MARRSLDVRGVLIHVSHYDPKWWLDKDDERPFEVEVALELVDAMARHGFNLLLVDCADGVKYKSHPELKRHYSVPMRDLKELADAAHRRGIDVVPKLNFAKSGRNLHDMWMRPYSDPLRWTCDLDVYYEVAGDVIAELVKVMRPKRFFHVGMDEDHHRSHAQYVDAIKMLRKIVKRHRLRTVIWNDSCHFRKDSLAQVHADKCRAAEKLLPHDIVQVLWDYGRAHPSIVKRVVDEGFEVWVAPGRRVLKSWKRAMAAGGATGVLATAWIKCDRTNRGRLLKLVRTLGAKF